jgi:hypothetical protein
MNYGRRRITEPKPWTPEQLAMLAPGRDAGKSWDELAIETGHSVQSCRTMLPVLKRRQREAEAAAAGESLPRTVNKRTWSHADVRILIHMRVVEKRPFPAIDAALKRPEGSSSSKFHTLRPQPGVTVPAPEPKQAAPARRIYHTSLTAELCGDPLPGRSALDRKRQAEGVSA